MIEAFGLGVRPREDATLESLQALEACSEVFSDLLVRETRAWLSALLPNVRYGASARDVVAAAASGRTVGLAVWGHARHASGLARETAALCAERGVPFRSRASNSPLGRAISESATFVGAEGYAGVLGHALEEALADPSRLDPELPLSIWSQNASKAQWKKLAAELSRLCGARRRAVVVPVLGPKPRVDMTVARLGELEGGAALMIVPDRDREKAPQ